MTDQKNSHLTPLIVIAAISVVAFSGIGVAAITGNLSIAHSNLNPFSTFSTVPISTIIQPAAAPTVSHHGLTRKRGESPKEGKPVNFQFGARIPARSAACANCGIVDSIIPDGPRQSADTSAPAASGDDIVAQKIAGISPSGYLVKLQMENGTVRTIHELGRPSFDIGERVKLVNGSVIRPG